MTQIQSIANMENLNDIWIGNSEEGAIEISGSRNIRNISHQINVRVDNPTRNLKGYISTGFPTNESVRAGASQGYVKKDVYRFYLTYPNLDDFANFIN